MKKFFTLTLAIAIALLSFAQGNTDMPAGVRIATSFDGHYIDPSSAQKGKFHHTANQSSSRAQTVGFYVDYGGVDELYSQQTGGDYLEDRIVQINRRLPVDSDNTLKWAFQWYPRIIDIDNGGGAWPPLEYSPSKVSMVIDTVVLTLAHDNTSGLNDTIQVTIWDLDALQTISIDSGCTGTLLGRATLITDTSLTGPGTTAGSYFIGSFALVPTAPIVIPANHRFVAQADFFGPGADVFFLLSSRRNDCANTCASVPYVNASFNPSIDSFNSLGAIRYVDATTPAQTGVYPTASFYNDCNQNQTQDPDNCERFYMQNLAIYPHVQATIPNFYVEATVDVPFSCPNGTVSLNASAAGSGATPYTYQWTVISGANSGNLLTSSDPQVQFSVGQNDGRVEIAVTDGNNVTVKDTVLVDSRGLTVTFTTNPTEIACGNSINLQPALGGYTTGLKTYAWTGGTTAASLGVNRPGTYNVTVTNSAGCTASGNVTVAYPGGLALTVTFTAPDVSPQSGSQVCEDVPAQSFTNTTVRQNGWTPQWTFGDGNLGFTNVATNAYATPGSYQVRLEMDSAGCVFSSAPQTVTVLPSSNNICMVGVNDMEFGNTINLMPNPTNGNLTITVNGVEKNVAIQVYNIIGSELINFTTNEVTSTFTKTFDLSHYANGTYLVKIQSGDKTAVKRVTVAK